MTDTPGFLERLSRSRAAWAFADQVHGGQRRVFDGAPFIDHPREVAALLYSTGSPDEVVAAGVLHDTVELTPTRLPELERRFGTNVAGLVAAVTEDRDIRSYAQRKAALRKQAIKAGEHAAALFAADKLSKVREYRAQLASHHNGERPPRPRRLHHYRASLVELERVIPRHPLVRELRRELEPLTLLPGVAAA